jgi:predicted nucleic acid-binding protein
MTTIEPELQYWDSCMFISLLTGKDKQRIETIRSLLKQEAKGHIKIVISTFVIVEVRPDQPGILAQNQFKMVTEIFESDRLDYRPLTPYLAQQAQNIGKDFPKLLPVDCVHIATAIEAKANVLFTFDGSGAKRRRPSDMIAHSRKIGNPPLLIREPFIPKGPLFDIERRATQD